MKKIESPTNASVKYLVSLRKRRQRQAESRTLIEGRREVERALLNQHPLQQLYLSSKALTVSDNGTLFRLAEEAGTEVIELSDQVFNKVAYRDHPDGVIAVGSTIGATIDTWSVNKNGLYLIADGIEKPGNLGAMARTAEATCIDAILICGEGTDIDNPNTIRASQGSIFAIPMITGERRQVIQRLKKAEITIYAAMPNATRSYWSCNFQGATAFIIGSESKGLDG